MCLPPDQSRVTGHTRAQKNTTRKGWLNLGLTYTILIGEEAGKKKALMGKQVTFMKNKCGLRRTDRRYNSFVAAALQGISYPGVYFWSLVIGVSLLWP